MPEIYYLFCLTNGDIFIGERFLYQAKNLFSKLLPSHKSQFLATEDSFLSLHQLWPMQTRDAQENELWDKVELLSFCQ